MLFSEYMFLFSLNIAESLPDKMILTEPKIKLKIKKVPTNNEALIEKNTVKINNENTIEVMDKTNLVFTNGS